MITFVENIKSTGYCKDQITTKDPASHFFSFLFWQRKKSANLLTSTIATKNCHIFYKNTRKILNLL